MIQIDPYYNYGSLRAITSHEIDGVFVDLVNKLNNLSSVNEVVRSGGSSRHVQVGTVLSRKKEQIFIKCPHPENHILNAHLAQLDQIAFLISNRLNLNVVPVTIAIEGYKDLINQILEDDDDRRYFISQNGYEGVSVQEGVEAHQDQLHLDKAMMENSPAAETDLLAKLDADQLCNAIFFNIITGRRDAREENSLIDRCNRIVEFDNEFIGLEKTDSWLLDFFPNFILPQKPIANLLSKDISIIDGVFKDMSHFPSCTIWDRKEKCYVPFNPKKIQETIFANFKMLRDFLSNHSEKVIKLRDLTMNLNLLASTTIRVHLDTQWGQSLSICGAGTRKLAWEEKKALPMNWTPGNIWSISIPAPQPICFKILLKTEDTGECKWMNGKNIETLPGQDLNLSSKQLSFR